VSSTCKRDGNGRPGARSRRSSSAFRSPKKSTLMRCAYWETPRSAMSSSGYLAAARSGDIAARTAALETQAPAHRWVSNCMHDRLAADSTVAAAISVVKSGSSRSFEAGAPAQQRACIRLVLTAGRLHEGAGRRGVLQDPEQRLEQGLQCLRLHLPPRVLVRHCQPSQVAMFSRGVHPTRRRGLLLLTVS